MKRARQCNDYVILQKAYEHFMDNGVITNPSPGSVIFPYTNRFSIQGINYDCLLGIAWKDSSSTGIVMAVTKEGVAIWFDGKRPPQLSEFNK
jgi:hypothetical protein